MTHNPDCDVNDINPDGIKKPCNCGSACSICGEVHTDDALCAVQPISTPTETPSCSHTSYQSCLRADECAECLRQKLAATTAQLEEARGDRERLDWLSAASMAGALIIATDVTQCYLSQASVPTYAPTLRQAIDAAMQQKDVLEPKQ